MECAESQGCLARPWASSTCGAHDRLGLSMVRCTAERTAEVHRVREELDRAQQAHSSLERDLAGALAMQQQEAQSMAKERDSAVARALAAETRAADLKEANDKLFQQQQVPAANPRGIRT